MQAISLYIDRPGLIKALFNKTAHKKETKGIPIMLRTIFLLCAFAFYSNVAFTQTLILSDKLQLNYDDPTLISHTLDTLIFKYKTWSFAHEIVDPKKIYQKVDLTGVERLYLNSIFSLKEREKLPNWLKALAEEQAESFGINNNNVTRRKIDSVEIVAAFNPQQSSSHIYIFEDLRVHHLWVQGDENKMHDVINRIGER